MNYTDQAARILISMTNQGFLWTVSRGDLVFWSPITRTGQAVDARILTDEDWAAVLGSFHLVLLTRYGLVWDEAPNGGFPPYN